MSESKLQIKVGNIEFSGEGNQEWLASQLEKMLDKVPELLKIKPESLPENVSSEDNTDLPKNGSANIKISNLASYLKEKNATVAQVKKFLATAAFLQINGKKRINTSDVTEALRNSNQSKLNNPSDCLNQNVKKGHCEKEGGNQFFVTSDGLAELGVTQ